MSRILNLLEGMLLNESFGFDYSFPSDKNKAIYDFYALSMIDPDKPDTSNYNIPEHDEDLMFSLKQAKKESVAKMRAFLEEALRRAVYAEIVHFQPFWDEELGNDFLEKSKHKDTFNKLWHRINPTMEGYYRADLPVYEDRYKMIKSLKIPDTEMYKFAAEAFGESKNSWHSSYGGEAWKRIADGAYRLVTAQNPGDLMVYIDHAIDLAHNTGSIFTKWPGVKVDKHTLDTKRDIKRLRDFSKLVSYELKRPLLHITRKHIAGDKEEKPESKYRLDAPHTPEDREPHERYEFPDNEQFNIWAENTLDNMGIKNLGMRETDIKSIVRLMKEKIKNEFENNWTDKKDPYNVADYVTSNYPDIYKNAMKKLEKEFGIDPENVDNIKIAIENLTDLEYFKSRKELLGYGPADYEDDVKKIMQEKWELKSGATIEQMMNYYYAKSEHKKGKFNIDFKDLDLDYLEKWLRSKYKNDDMKSFNEFKRTFIPEFEKASHNDMTRDQKEKIKELIDKVEKSEYGKEGHPRLKLK